MNDVIDNETGQVLDVSNLPAEVSPQIAAEINQQVATAKRYPRRPDSQIADEIYSRATVNEAIATECNYSLKRGNKAITGPSIRFAEIVRASFGNIRVASRFVRIDADDPTRAAVIVEAVAFDMQTNNSEVIQVRRSIMTSPKQGERPRMFNADMVNTTVNAGASIARRNAILAVVPKAIWIESYQGALKIIAGTAATLGQRRLDAVAAFKEEGVDQPTLLAAVGCRTIEDVTIEHLIVLRGMLTAIREGENPDSVLGRLGVDQPVHVKVTNPLRDHPEDTQQAETGNRTVRQAASNQGQKAANEAGTGTSDQAEQTQERRDPISTGTQAAGEVSGEVSGEARTTEGAKTGAAPKASQAPARGAPKEKPYRDAESYLDHMRDTFDRASSKAAISDAWKATRADRNELLDAQQIDDITAEKDKAIAKFDNGGV